MKNFFVWLTIGIIYGIINVGFKLLGITLGAIPTIILLLVLFALASLMISAISEAKKLQNQKDDTTLQDEILKSKIDNEANVESQNSQKPNTEE